MYKPNYSKKQAWLAWGLASVFYMYQFFIRSSSALIVDELMADFAINAKATCDIMAKYYLGYTLMQIPVSVLMVRFGAKNILMGCILLCALGCLAFARAHDVYVVSLARFAIGAGAAGSFLGALQMALTRFDLAKFGMLSGLTISLGMMGSVLGQSLSDLPWRVSMQILAGIGFGLCLAMLLFVREDKVEDTVEDTAAKESIGTLLITVIKKYDFWLYSLAGTLMYSVFTLLIDMWGIGFLKLKYGIDTQQAANINIMFQTGLFCASPFIGQLSSIFKSHRSGLIISITGCLLAISTILYVDTLPLAGAYVSFFVLGVAFSGKVISFVAIADTVGQKLASTATALCNMIIMLGCGELLRLAGWLMVYFWDGSYTSFHDKTCSIPFHNLLNIKQALSIEIAFLGLAVIAVLAAKESFKGNAQ